MEKRKTDTSVKAGLELEAKTNPLRKRRKRISADKNSAQRPADNNAVEPKEIDVDDVVHEPDFEPTAVFNKENSDVSTGTVPMRKKIPTTWCMENKL